MQSVIVGTVWWLQYEAAGDNCACSQETQTGSKFGCNNPRPSPSEPLPAANLAPPNRALQAFKTVSPSGDHVNKHISIWGAFYTQTTMAPFSIAHWAMCAIFGLPLQLANLRPVFSKGQVGGSKFSSFLKLNNIALYG